MKSIYFAINTCLNRKNSDCSHDNIKSLNFDSIASSQDSTVSPIPIKTISDFAKEIFQGGRKQQLQREEEKQITHYENPYKTHDDAFQAHGLYEPDHGSGRRKRQKGKARKWVKKNTYHTGLPNLGNT